MAASQMRPFFEMLWPFDRTYHLRDVMSENERLTPPDCESLATKVRGITERALTPLIKTFLTEIYGTSDFVIVVANKRRRLKADTNTWGYSNILRAIFSHWPQFEKEKEAMISLRDRSHHPDHDMGPFEDEDLISFCKYNEQLLRKAGALGDAERVRSVLPQYLQLAWNDLPRLSTYLPEHFLSAKECFDKTAATASGRTPPSAVVGVVEATMSLKGRGVEQGVVRQSFSHGRTKAHVVEKVKRRVGAEKPKTGAAPAVPTAVDGEKQSEAPIKTLSLKRSVEQGVVPQSFSHGRTKAKVVEKVKRRVEPEPGPAPAVPTAVDGKKQSEAPTKTLSLKRSVEQGVVPQSFSHGRTKAKVVEKVKRSDGAEKPETC
jgi:hypothetical protein